jgi:hypothetical protein
LSEVVWTSMPELERTNTPYADPVLAKVCT